MWQMPADRFLLLVPRLEAYAGAVAARMNVQREQQARQTEGRQMPTTRPDRGGPPAQPGVRVIGATAAELGMSDIGDLFSHGSSGGR
jgi:hypothetical protein